MKVIGLSVCVFTALFVSINIGLGILKGYPWDDMDWNQDGRVTFVELMQAKDVGVRALEGNCKEYFAFKDGQPIKRICAAE